MSVTIAGEHVIVLEAGEVVTRVPYLGCSSWQNTREPEHGPCRCCSEAHDDPPTERFHVGARLTPAVGALRQHRQGHE